MGGPFWCSTQGTWNIFKNKIKQHNALAKDITKTKNTEKMSHLKDCREPGRWAHKSLEITENKVKRRNISEPKEKKRKWAIKRGKTDLTDTALTVLQSLYFIMDPDWNYREVGLNTFPFTAGWITCMDFRNSTVWLSLNWRESHLIGSRDGPVIKSTCCSSKDSDLIPSTHVVPCNHL